ncbi:MAG: hypothetical protein HDR33_02980 [Treponema sp.]|nr:hypothetical protein [Treponema sp.]
MSENKLSTIHFLLERSVDLLYENDSCLITNSVHEQAISHRIAHYLENLLIKYDWFVKDGYSVDVEYNRNGDEVKKVCGNCDFLEQHKCKLKKSLSKYRNCRPDIIVHKRGCNNIFQDDFDNLIVIEIKKEEEEDKSDFSKLKSFTCEYSAYKYHLGIYINIDKSQTEPSFTYFQNRQEVAEKDIDWKESRGEQE